MMTGMLMALLWVTRDARGLGPIAEVGAPGTQLCLGSHGHVMTHLGSSLGCPVWWGPWVSRSTGKSPGRNM